MSIFKKLFGNKTNTPASKSKPTETPKSNNEKAKNALNTPMEEVKKEAEGYTSLGRSIFPVLKDENDVGIKMVANTNPIISHKIVDGIVLCYVIDIGNNLQRISESHLSKFNLDKQIVHNTAVRNLIDKINIDCQIKVHDYSSQNENLKPFIAVTN